jgi:GTPase
MAVRLSGVYPGGLTTNERGIMYEPDHNKSERAILVAAGKGYDGGGSLDDNDPLEELRLLVDTSGATVVDTLVQLRNKIDPAYYIGTGKAEELDLLVKEHKADMVVFDNDLSPAQVANLQKLLEIKVLDRSALILDIFSIRARTRQAKTQVELAQLRYLLPRLTRQWTHLSRQQGGIGTRGPGETQLEVDRRAIRARIKHLEQALEQIVRQRVTERRQRSGVFRAALVGYTNAGKSTLLNTLSGAGVPVEDKLFKTLDSVTRTVRFGHSTTMLISDTVGFIRNLPHHLVASFASTLDEVREADVLLHVVDISNPDWEAQITVVNEVLEDLKAGDTETIMVFNKIDRLDNPGNLTGLTARFPGACTIAAQTDEGIEALCTALISATEKGRVTYDVRVDPGDSDLISTIYRHATIIDSREDGDLLRMVFSLPHPLAEKLGFTSRFAVGTNTEESGTASHTTDP